MTDLFRTVVVPEALEKKFSYDTPAFFLGSCFSASVGEWLRDLKFPVQVNPSGVLYNPFSIKNTLERLLEGRSYDEADLVKEGGRWISLMHDTSFAGEDKSEVLERINYCYTAAADHLKKLKYLFLTFGTARVYHWKRDGAVVANCHKLPATLFERRLLTPEEIVEAYEGLLQQLFRLNPGLQVVFTVSPVRHWKDGAVGNQLSKSVLHVALHRLLEKDERLHYFPAYEIMMDDLRDYRFYGRDMLHLSDTAVEYIRERFRETVVAPEAYPVMDEMEKIRRALAHRPFRPESEEYRTFKASQLKKILALEEKYPFLDLSEEKEVFK
jgi:hypothetical protein